MKTTISLTIICLSIFSSCVAYNPLLEKTDDTRSVIFGYTDAQNSYKPAHYLQFIGKDVSGKVFYKTATIKNSMYIITDLPAGRYYFYTMKFNDSTDREWTWQWKKTATDFGWGLGTSTLYYNKTYRTKNGGSTAADFYFTKTRLEALTELYGYMKDSPYASQIKEELDLLTAPATETTTEESANS